MYQVVTLGKSPFGASLCPLARNDSTEITSIANWIEFAAYRANHHKHVYNTFRGQYLKAHLVPQAPFMEIKILPFTSNDLYGRVWSDADFIPFDEYCRRCELDTSLPTPEPHPDDTIVDPDAEQHW